MSSFAYLGTSSENRPTHLHSSCCHSEMPWNIRTLMGALKVSMIRLHLVYIWWVSDQYIQSSHESTVYNRHQSALGLVCLCLLGGSTVVLLGGDTVVPSGLYIRLCHAFLVSFYFFMTLHCMVSGNLWQKLCFKTQIWMGLEFSAVGCAIQP